jgi:acetyl esterase/lipase
MIGGVFAVLYGLALYSNNVISAESDAPMDPNVNVLHDVVYGTGGGRPLHMDLYALKAPPKDPLPVVVWIHGGGWYEGDKETGQHMAEFAAAGYLGVSVEYRLSGEARFPAQIEDCKCAIRFLRAHAQQYHLDPNRIGVWGSSAGGHLVALLGTSGGVKALEGHGGWANYSSRVNAVADWFGPTNFLRMDDFPCAIRHNDASSPESRLIGGPIQEHKGAVKKANPISYISKDDPPFLLMHGDEDNVVPINQSVLLYHALKLAGVDAEFHRVHKAGHGFDRLHLKNKVLTFFDRHLRGKGP